VFEQNSAGPRGQELTTPVIWDVFKVMLSCYMD